nr:MAG TPA: hypothetical protein [Caudoviricetes sp.]
MAHFRCIVATAMRVAFRCVYSSHAPLRAAADWETAKM